MKIDNKNYIAIKDTSYDNMAFKLKSKGNGVVLKTRSERVRFEPGSRSAVSISSSGTIQLSLSSITLRAK